MNAMARLRDWCLFLIALVFLVPLVVPRAWAIDVGDIAPNFKAYEEVSEEDMEFYPYVEGRVTMLWIWDWSMGCPI